MSIGKEKLMEMLKKELRTDSRGRRDLCSLYGNRASFEEMVKYLAEPFAGKVDYVASPESLGFILGSAIAAQLEAGFIPIRNGSLSYLGEEDAVKASYIDHRDSVRTIQVRKGIIPEGKSILLVDDWVETAATIQACMTLVEEADAHVTGIVSFGVNRGPATEEMLEHGLIRSIVIR